MDRLRDCVEGMVKFTLDYREDFDLGLTGDFCSGLVSGETLLLVGDRIESNLFQPTRFSDADSVEGFAGVPDYPLYKRLALGLLKSIDSGCFRGTFEKISLATEVIWLKERDDEWSKLIIQKGLELVNVSRSWLYTSIASFLVA